MIEASLFLSYGFKLLLLPLLTAAGYIAQRYGGLSRFRFLIFLLFWMSLTAAVAINGTLRQWDMRPPPILILLSTLFIGALILSRQTWHKNISKNAPLWVLIIFHSFRLPLELIMHRAANEGVMPQQMSYSGYNFDIVSGVFALVLGLIAMQREVPKAIVWAFNVIGSLLLLNIITIATLSTPVVAAFGPTKLNTWVAYYPFVWLPTIYVALAILGHIALTRRLLRN